MDQQPRRPRNAYTIFFQEERQNLLHAMRLARANQGRNSQPTNNNNNTSGFADLARQLSKRWKALSASDKKVYVERAEREREMYMFEQRRQAEPSFPNIGSRNLDLCNSSLINSKVTTFPSTSLLSFPMSILQQQLLQDTSIDQSTSCEGQDYDFRHSRIPGKDMKSQQSSLILSSPFRPLDREGADMRKQDDTPSFSAATQLEPASSLSILPATWSPVDMIENRRRQQRRSRPSPLGGNKTSALLGPPSSLAANQGFMNDSSSPKARSASFSRMIHQARTAALIAASTNKP